MPRMSMPLDPQVLQGLRPPDVSIPEMPPSGGPVMPPMDMRGMPMPHSPGGSYRVPPIGGGPTPAPFWSAYPAPPPTLGPPHWMGAPRTPHPFSPIVPPQFGLMTGAGAPPNQMATFPDQLSKLNPNLPPAPGGGGANPFQGNQNPGAFTTPAPFNPLLAQTLLGQRGSPILHGYPPIMPRGPMGGFGLAPDSQRPRGQRANPYA